MDDHRTDLWAGLLLMLFFVATLLGGWVVLRFTVP